MIRNIHERTFRADADRVGALIDTLASDDDRLWPRDRWPAIRFDRPLAVGAIGGHGPIRYVVSTYERGRSIRFRFTAPRGFIGWHGLDAVSLDGGGTRFVHALEMHAEGPARFTWPLAYRWLHDALLEDALDNAARALGEPSNSTRWSWYVRILRCILRVRRRR